jgi:hypothetical protein
MRPVAENWISISQAQRQRRFLFRDDLGFTQRLLAALCLK